MSSDNYYYVRKEGGKYYVTHHFMSDEDDLKALRGGQQYDTLSEALAYTDTEYSEYGTMFAPNVWDELVAQHA